MQGEPAVHRAGDGDRKRPERGYAPVVRVQFAARLHLRYALLQLRQGLSPGGTTGAVVAIQLPGSRVPHDGEEVAADAVAGGLHQAQCGVGGDRRVDRRAALLEDVERYLGGQRMGGGRHPPGAVDGAARPGLAYGTAPRAQVRRSRRRLRHGRLGSACR